MTRYMAESCRSSPSRPRPTPAITASTLKRRAFASAPAPTPSMASTRVSICRRCARRPARSRCSSPIGAASRRSDQMPDAATSRTDQAKWARWRAVANLYHAFFTGLILTVVTRKGVPAAEEFVFRVFRRQQEERFLAGLDKLGLRKLPPAVAAAQYHYLSNWIGGVHVEYMYESDRKAWIRYPPPRWIWQGTAICGIPMEVSRAMLRGWHANNGVALKNLKLGFVCTKQTVDVQDGLEGYYYEYDRDLATDERLVFARHLEAPPFDPGRAPALPVDAWPKQRLEKAYRNYAMEYVRTAAP